MLQRIYTLLFNHYGPQGWWPVLKKKRGSFISVYDPGFKNTRPSIKERLEISIGAILTQNTNWRNASAALVEMKRKGLISLARLRECQTLDLAESIRASGYFNQKAKKIRALASFFSKYALKQTPRRDDLLAIWGIGPETADSILLYAYGQPVFVVDAYTRRIFSRLTAITGSEAYDAIAKKFVTELPTTTAVYNEYHALIVAHAVQCCRTKPLCQNCCLWNVCPFPHNGG